MKDREEVRTKRGLPFLVSHLYGGRSSVKIIDSEVIKYVSREKVQTGGLSLVCR